MPIFDVQGSVHVGDKGGVSGDLYGEKNIIKGGAIKAGGDFRLGDDDTQIQNDAMPFKNRAAGI